MSITVLKALEDKALAGHRKFPAAQLMRMSIFPNSFRACSTAAVMARGARTSRDRGRHLWLVAAASFLAAIDTLGRLLLAMTVWQPCRMKISAIRNPIPEPPPVMKATLSWSKSGWKRWRYSGRQSSSLTSAGGWAMALGARLGGKSRDPPGYQNSNLGFKGREAL